MRGRPTKEKITHVEAELRRAQEHLLEAQKYIVETQKHITIATLGYRRKFLHTWPTGEEKVAEK